MPEREELVRDEVRERVEQELRDLLDKITNLTKFYYGEGMLKANLSKKMKDYLYMQLETMKHYAHYLQCRLEIWGKTDEEIVAEQKERADKIGGLVEYVLY